MLLTTDPPASPGEDREVVVGSVANPIVAEGVVARLATIGTRSGGVNVFVEPIADDPATSAVECGVALRAEVAASQADAARAALKADGRAANDGGSGGI